MRIIVDQYVQPRAGQTIADLGCGTGDLAEMLPDTVAYIGVDHNAAYLDSLQVDTVAGGRQFLNGDLGALEQVGLPPIDTAVAIGVLHHLNDDEMRGMLRSVAAVLVPGGKLVTVDPVFAPDQASSARIMMAMDRGRFVRHREHYEMVFHEAFPDAVSALRTDFLPFPYTHCIFEATQAAR